MRTKTTKAVMTSETLAGPIEGIRAALNGAYGASRRWSSTCWPACWRGGTCWWKTCPAWARRPWPRHWRRRWAASLLASSAPRICSRATSPDSASSISNTREFEFLPGPVFADVLLADEINRTTPRTQSALLEAMAERQVTVDNVRHVLSDTFFVIATQNPVEQHGTYPLPEAQLDRFAMKLRIGYPGREHELAMLEAAVGRDERGDQSVPSAMEPGQLRALQDRVAEVAVGAAVREYLVALAHATRTSPGHAWPEPPRTLDLAAAGAGPRVPRRQGLCHAG